VEEGGEEAAREPVPRLRSKEYMEDFINPEEYLEAQRKRIEEEAARGARFPEEPEKDILLFLIEHGHLEKWQRDVLSIVREEGYYFAPQAQTKIMNEGWAAYWHSKCMTEQLLTDAEVIDYADHHSGTLGMRPGSLNPYKIGIELFRDIEDRWNRGKFGKDYDDCDDYREKREWDRKLGLGRGKIFEVRAIMNDVLFIDTFLTPEFCREQKFFTYARNERTGNYEIQDREFLRIKEQLLFQLTNFGQPFVYVENGNYENRAELLLRHVNEGVDLDKAWAIDTLKNVQRLWGRTVHLESAWDGEKKLLTANGAEVTEKEVGEGA
jgi:stage V sporulation protein R